MSHPSRVCGLKYRQRRDIDDPGDVTPFTGVWIEIASATPPTLPAVVTPFTGVWIEIDETLKEMNEEMESHPSRVCGLK